MSARMPSASADVKLLDCTLRDGGYYNDWDFAPDLIRQYLAAMSGARIPLVELGFRSLDRNGYLGPTAYTTDRLIESLDVPNELTIGVMVNAKELVSSRAPAAVIDQLFGPQSDSRVQLVRIAAHFGEVVGLRPAVERLRDLGYAVGVNLMQIASKSDEQITEFAGRVAEWGVSVAYFADSFGGMLPHDIARVVGAMRRGFPGPIGCHTHDNMSLAFANSLSAIEAGATYVDSTLLGMGRGPGNARTEYLAIELQRRGLCDADGMSLLPIVTGQFAELQRQYGWGSNPYYFLSAVNNVHPTYIQDMTKDGRYSVHQMVTALGSLAREGGSSYDPDRVTSLAEDVREVPERSVAGTFDATNWCAGRDLLIVGPGPSGVDRRCDIEAYIIDMQPLVVALNVVPPVSPELVDAYAICSPVRAAMDQSLIGQLDRRTFIPAQMSASPNERLGVFFDYGISFEPGKFEVKATECVVPHAGAFAYALALAKVGGARSVGLVGFDGFETGDPRQAAMQEVIDLYSSAVDSPELVALTRTTYRIAQSSIYAR